MPEQDFDQHFTYGKLLRFTLPSIIMMIFSSVYGVVDGLFVSNFAGKTAFTAINFIIVSIPSLSPDIQNTFQGLVLIVVILIQTLSPIVKEKITLYRKRKAQK